MAVTISAKSTHNEDFSLALADKYGLICYHTLIWVTITHAGENGIGFVLTK